MSSNLVQRPLASLAIPQSGAQRFIVQAAMVVAGSLLLALSAKAKVVLGPVDMSLQTLAVLLIAATFGFRLGVATLLVYLAEGAAGLPVFQGTPEKGIGLVYMMGSTGGYLAGFLVMAAIVGWAVDRGCKNIVRAPPFHRRDVMLMRFSGWQSDRRRKSWEFGVARSSCPWINCGTRGGVTAAPTG